LGRVELKFAPGGLGCPFFGGPSGWGARWEPKFVVVVVFPGDNGPPRKPSGRVTSAGETTT
jgi:hypothetical protein